MSSFCFCLPCSSSYALIWLSFMQCMTSVACFLVLQKATPPIRTEQRGMILNLSLPQGLTELTTVIGNVHRDWNAVFLNSEMMACADCSIFIQRTNTMNITPWDFLVVLLRAMLPTVKRSLPDLRRFCSFFASRQRKRARNAMNYAACLKNVDIFSSGTTFVHCAVAHLSTVYCRDILKPL